MQVILFALLCTLVTALFSIGAATAQQPVFDLPVDCVLGDTCYIQNYVDRDSGSDSADFTCAQRTYDGHKGTDIAVPTLADMHAGVAVFAAADGIVTGLRDGMPDTLYTSENAAEIAGRDCGNGIVIRHPDGWETQYCHMMEGSISVTNGLSVARGTRLGLIGLSGRTQFPHLHLSVRHNGQIVDPFDASATATCAQDDNKSMWRDTPLYIAGGLLDAGFSNAVPAYDAIKSGTADIVEFAPSSAAIVFWAFGFGVVSGDQLHITIDGPDGPVIDKTVEIANNRAQFFRASGRKRPAAGWPKGAYTGTAQLLRNGDEISRFHSTIRVE